MIYQNKTTESGLDPNQELQDQRDEMVAISSRIEGLKDQEKQFKDRTGELKSLEKDIELKSDIKNRLLTEVGDLGREKDSLFRTVDATSTQKKMELSKIDEEIAYKATIKASLNNDLDNLKIEITNLDKIKSGKEDKTNEAVSDIEEVLIKKREEEALLTSSIDNLRTEIQTLISKKDELGKDIIDLNNITVQKKGELTSIENEIVIAMRQLDAINKDAGEKVEEMKAFEEQKTIEYAQIQKRLDEREGIVSDRESWVTDREKKVLSMKTELEAFHGKKINIWKED